MITDSRLIWTPHYYGLSLNMDTSLFTDTRLIWTPHYYGQFALSLEKKTITFSLNSTRLIYGHPINMDTFYGSLSVLINRV